MVRATSVSVNCPTCGVTHVVDRDEDGKAATNWTRCIGSDICDAKICADCALACDACGHLCCPDHVHTTYEGLRLCDICSADDTVHLIEADEEPEPPCECRYIDADLVDTSGCPIHWRE